MLDSVSCWYFDWNVAGTWFGGLMSALAVAVALVISRRDANRRTKYARFLLLRDLAAINPVVDLLRDAAKSMASFEELEQVDPDYEIKAGWHQDIWLETRKVLTSIPGKFEVFGRSERLFELREDGVDFMALEKAVNEALAIEKLVSDMSEFATYDVIAIEVNAVADALEAALTPFAQQAK